MKRILIIQTGGTIAMDISKSAQRARVNPEKWSKVIDSEIPELSQIAEIDMEELFFEDSSDIHCDHWVKLIHFIKKRYSKYDGFVILHGTDTMAYTASALSFGLQHIDKPVILTSQVPMSNIRSDARRNLVNSVEMATFPLYEVAICFNDFVYRGNRTTKMSIGDFDAFSSPNFPPLAEIGLNIEINIHGEQTGVPLDVSTDFNDQIFLLKLYPGLNTSFLDELDLSNTRALIVEAFGSGNFPMKGGRSLLPFLQKCVEHDIIVAITSQAAYDAVDLSKYKSGQKALEIGAIGAGDMTSEAALTKMMYLLGKHDEAGQIKTIFCRNIAGELTE